jgi:hypothetical protein
MNSNARKWYRTLGLRPLEVVLRTLADGYSHEEGAILLPPATLLARRLASRTARRALNDLERWRTS